jgi:hypothetical protein
MSALMVRPTAASIWYNVVCFDAAQTSSWGRMATEEGNKIEDMKLPVSLMMLADPLLSAC